MVTRIKTPLILAYFIGFILFLAPILGFIAPKGLAPLVILGGLGGFIIIRAQRRLFKWPPTRLIIILLVFCIWAFVSIFWAIDTRSAVIGVGKLTGNLIIGGLFFTIIKSLNVWEKQIAFKWLFFGFFLVLLMLALEVYMKHPIISLLKGGSVPIHYPNEFFWLNAVVVILSSLLWPLSLAKYKKSIENQTTKRTVLIIICGFSVIIFLSVLIGFASGTVALIFGIIGAAAVQIFGRRSVFFGAGALVFIGLLLPFGFNNFETLGFQKTHFVNLGPSANHRLKIWEFTANKVDQNIITGWGLNASKHIPGGKDQTYSDGGKRFGQALPLHPHSSIFQIWLELGLPGIIIYLGLSVYIIISSVKPYRSKPEVAMIVGQFLTLMVIANLSYGTWQAWWIATLWLSASLMNIVLENPETTKHSNSTTR